jgi:putative oxygen-independent coproporphyrinogen III oxidase
VSQGAVDPSARPNLGLYVHWPYCTRICPYCDFNVVRDRGQDERKARLARALGLDIAAHAQRLGPRRLVSISFGGGTPSLMEPAQVAAVIAAARSAWPSSAPVEVSLEANPADARPRTLEALAAAGIGRLSLGVQSFDDANLTLLGRNHDARTARRAAVDAARVFERLSIDMIWGLPGQDAHAWTADLRSALDLGPEHISAYELTFETGTAFDRARRRGRLTPPPDAVRADLFDLTVSLLEAEGFDAYEVSNHARGTAARARHNLVYWRGEDYVGVGPGAHGRLTLDGCRWAAEAPRAVDDYIRTVEAEGLGASLERLDPHDVALERLLMGLRTVEGVAMGELAPLAIPASRYGELDGLILRQDDRLVATPRGRPVLDAVIARLAA